MAPSVGRRLCTLWFENKGVPAIESKDAFGLCTYRHELRHESSKCTLPTGIHDPAGIRASRAPTLLSLPLIIMNILENGVGYLAPSTSAEPQPGYLAVSTHPRQVLGHPSSPFPAHPSPARRNPCSPSALLSHLRLLLALWLPSLHRRGSFRPQGMGAFARPNIPHGRRGPDELLVVINRIWPFTKLSDAQPEDGSAVNVQTVLETLYDRRAVSI